MDPDDSDELPTDSGNIRELGYGKPPVEHRFKPGNRMSPGRPKGSSVSDRLRSLVEQSTINGKPLQDGKQVADLLAEVIIKESLKGDVRWASILMDRLEGRPLQTIKSDVNASVTHHDGDIGKVLAALGYVRRGDPAVSGEGEPGGICGGGERGGLDISPPPEPAE